MKSLSIMIKPASSLCNMRCKYCFYTDEAQLRETKSFGIMSVEKAHTLIDNVLEQLSDGDNLTFAFQGGEPTLAGCEFFRSFIEYTEKNRRQININWVLQTNGTLLDDKWCTLLAKNRFLVGLSYDLLPDVNDSARVDIKGMPTTKSVQNAIMLLDRHSIDYNILCTLTEPLAKHPQKVWNTIIKNKIKYIQFTPCLDGLEENKKNLWALKPSTFAHFYITLFKKWLDEFKKDNYISVKLFDDYVNYIAHGRLGACGLNGNCQPQIIIESDGSTFPCDFYCLDEYKLGNIFEDSLQELYKKSYESARKRSRPGILCQDCRYLNFCGGGCIRMRHSVCFKDSDSVCGIKTFLDSCGTELAEIAKYQ